MLSAMENSFFVFVQHWYKVTFFFKINRHKLMIYYENCVDLVKQKTDLSNYRLDQLFYGYRIM